VASQPFSHKPTLAGGRVTLRPFRGDDVAAMAAALADPEVRILTGSVASTEEAEAGDDRFGDLESWYATRNAQRDRLDLAVEDRATGRCVGEVVLNEWEPSNGACNFRILIGADGRGRGLGTEATTLLLGYAFDELGLHRVSLGVYAFNPRARHVYERAGFVVEGVDREALLFDGRRVDMVRMAVLAPEWAARGRDGSRRRARGRDGSRRRE
jgi:RimJ/RimL family protein N-acetyltransferase